MFNLFKSKIRTRFAPSPTGYLHVGGLRTALYAYLFAKQAKGTFFLRIEDTDQSREVQGAVENLLKSLKWAGIEAQEGMIADREGKVAEKGHFGPYTQSQRLEIYRKHAEELVKEGKAYYCFCSSERLESVRKTQEANNQPTRYDWHCRYLSDSEVQQKIEAGVPHVIRMKVPENRDIEFDDLIRGKVKFNTRDIDDQVLIKSDGFPTYHLAHAVDDHLMKTSHIIRGEEWLSSTPKHLLLFEFFNWRAPQYAHLPLILNKDKTKLSKRQGDVAVEDYRDKGYLPEALINFIALLGWNPGTEKEIFSLEELVEVFDFKKIHKAGAVFDLDKLDWMNGEYIKKMTLDKFTELAKPYLEVKKLGSGLDEAVLKKALAMEQSRIKKLNEVGEGIGFMFNDKLDYEPAILIWKKTDAVGAKKCLELLISELEKYEEKDWHKETLEKNIIEFIKANNLNNGEVLWPMRVALTGLEKSPTPFEVAEALGKIKTMARLAEASARLS